MSTGLIPLYLGKSGESSEKSMLCGELSGLLGMRINRVVNDSIGRYIVYADGCSIVLRNFQTLSSQRRFNNAVVGACNRAIPTFRPEEWRNVVSLLLAAIKPEVNL